MVDGDLMVCLDWRRQPGEKHGQYSYREGEVWYVVQSGPGFSNTHRVTEYDGAGLAWLKRIERKGETGAQDRTVQP